MTEPAAVHNPDVLSCLANLSSDEVFTPPAVANAMLDLLPPELFRSPDTAFLDPACKSGVFLREIARRLVAGLADTIPDLERRVEHICRRQLFGIGITGLTALMSRRSLYCSKYPNSKYSVCRFGDAEGNIRFRVTNHEWQNGRCEICGAPQDVFGDAGRGESLENHAYEFIHAANPEEIFNMKFDVIISNPPYQLSDGGGNGASAMPIYHMFVQQAMKLKPTYLTMITPSRWFTGGKGLDEFRDQMLHDDRLRIIHDFPEANDCFRGVQIKGGVSYFLWERDNKGKCKVFSHKGNVVSKPCTRTLLEKNCDTFIRYNEAIEILHKIQVLNEQSMMDLVSVRMPFGIPNTYKGNKQKTSSDDVIIYVSGNDRDVRGTTAYVPKKEIKKGKDMIPWHKVYISKAGSGSDTFPHPILTQPFYGEPQTVCNESYLVIGKFPDKKTCQNVISYISTQFFRFLVLLKKNSQNAARGVYQLVPVQDFSKPWTDAELYEKYGLTQAEQEFIESMVRPMDTAEGGGDGE